MSVTGGITSGLRKFETQVTIGATEGEIDLTHNLGTINYFITRVEVDSNGAEMIIPIKAKLGTNPNVATIESTSSTSRLVNITIIG